MKICLPAASRRLLIPLLFISAQAIAQQEVITRFEKTISYLADDKLEGRATGSAGEQLASAYIIQQFNEIGLTPAGDAGTYLQSFEARSGKKPGEENYIIAASRYSMDKQHYPHPMTGNGTASGNLIAVGFGITAPALSYDDYAGKDVKGKIVLIKTSSPDGTHPHSKYIEFNDERKKIQLATANGAAGVIFYNEDANYELPGDDYRRNVTAENIPVFIVDSTTAKSLLQFTGTVELHTQLNEEVRTGHNVLGFIDNHASNTVVIGAHYDHLGHGEIEGSLYRGAPAIHNGADDNASGVAMMIELARFLKQMPSSNNYLFIAFSGEEMGLFGSKAFTQSPMMLQYQFNYMLNYDMVGRMDTTNAIIINGVGTSPAWATLKSISNFDMTLTTTESGIGPSDQTSFYLKDIPVVHFFTGSHADYHKPSDDAGLINYMGMLKVFKYSIALISALDDDGKLAFTKTQDSNNENTPRFKVTMGVVPDYAYSGKGMRVDGVTDGKPAQAAGVIAGDIVIKLGSFDVTDMMGYMTALSKFTKGETVTLVVLRNNAPVELQVTF